MAIGKLAAKLAKRAAQKAAGDRYDSGPVFDPKSKRWVDPVTKKFVPAPANAEAGKYPTSTGSKNQSSKSKGNKSEPKNTKPASSDSRSKFKHVNRRADYRMKYGKDIERTKQVASAAGAITGSTGTSAVGDWHAQEEETKRAQIRADASKANAKEFAAAMKDKTYSEKKHYVIEGIGSLQSGGSVKTVNPAEDDSKYSV